MSHCFERGSPGEQGRFVTCSSIGGVATKWNKAPPPQSVSEEKINTGREREERSKEREGIKGGKERCVSSEIYVSTRCRARE